MFDRPLTPAPKDPIPFLSWMDRFVLTPDNRRQARDMLYEAEALVSELSNMHSTVQSAKHHAEGLVLSDHLERMLTTLLAITNGTARLRLVEEFVSHKDLRDIFEDLEDTICEHAATLKAFIFLHDIGKASCMSFDAPIDSLGAKEGFYVSKQNDACILADRYLKLARALQVEHPEYSAQELCIAFYQKYNIDVHYKGHARLAVSDTFKEARVVLEDLARLGPKECEMLFLSIKYHMDVIRFFKTGADPAHYQFLETCAKKSGLDADDVVDFQAAALFLDAVAGSISFDSKPSADTALLIHFLRSEEQYAFDRLHHRRARQDLKQRKAFKQMLTQAQLDTQTLIEELKIPVGPERATLVVSVERAVRTGNVQELGPYAQILANRVHKAHLHWHSSIQ